MKFKTLLFISSISLSSVAIATDTTDAKETTSNATDSKTELMNQAHAKANVPATLAISGHAPAKPAKDEPFWSKDQTQQAEKEKKYKKQIAENSDNKQAYTYLAGLYLTNNKTLKAIKAYQEAITHDPENPKLFAAISIAYLHQGKYDMSKAMADEALRIDPSLKQVDKINEYIVAKQKAIEAASKVSASDVNAEKGSMGSGAAPHGGIMPTAMGEKPSDSIHGVVSSSKEDNKK